MWEQRAGGELRQWLQNWSSSLKSTFKRFGKNAMNRSPRKLLRRVCVPRPIEMNASDMSSKKLVKDGKNINNLDEWMAGQQIRWCVFCHGFDADGCSMKKTDALGVTTTSRTCLIVDGMLAGDRGGVSALNALIRKTRIPIICIANDAGAQKLKSPTSTICKLPFRKRDFGAVGLRMLLIVYKFTCLFLSYLLGDEAAVGQCSCNTHTCNACRPVINSRDREKMKIPVNIADQRSKGVQLDIRQVLNMISTWQLSKGQGPCQNGWEIYDYDAVRHDE